jgi:hypothetical protein
MSVVVMEDYKLRDLRASHTMRKKKKVFALDGKQKEAMIWVSNQ